MLFDMFKKKKEEPVKIPDRIDITTGEMILNGVRIAKGVGVKDFFQYRTDLINVWDSGSGSAAIRMLKPVESGGISANVIIGYSGEYKKMFVQISPIVPETQTSSLEESKKWLLGLINKDALKVEEHRISLWSAWGYIEASDEEPVWSTANDGIITVEYK